MSFRTELLKAVVKLRELPGPTQLDVYVTRVIVRTRSWSGGEVKLGHPTDADIELFPRPKVRNVGEGSRVVTVGPITPSNAAGGYTLAQLNPSEHDSVESYYILIGPDGVSRPYKLTQIDQKRAFRYTLVLESLDRRMPF